MAVTLTLRHWVAGAALGCAALTAALIPVPDASRDPRIAIQRVTARDLVGRALGRAHRAALYLSRRDELLAALRARSQPGEPPVVIADPGRPVPIGAAGLAHFRTLVDSAVRAISPLDPSVTLAIVVTSDTSYPTPGGRITFRGDWYALPEATDGHTCLVVVPLPRQGRPSLLGPCTFYAAFGRPGPGVRRWLEAVNYYPADEPDWTQPAVHRSINRPEQSSFMAWDQIVQASPRLGMTLEATGCAAGRNEYCRAFLETPPWWIGRRGNVFMRSIIERGGWWGDEMQVFLADLVRDKGRERFGEFWRSPLPRDSAFAAAYGMPMDEWTHRWLSAQRPNVHVGPGIRFSSVVLGLLVAGVLVAGGAYYTTRRQIA